MQVAAVSSLLALLGNGRSMKVNTQSCNKSTKKATARANQHGDRGTICRTSKDCEEHQLYLTIASILPSTRLIVNDCSINVVQNLCLFPIVPYRPVLFSTLVMEDFDIPLAASTTSGTTPVQPLPASQQQQHNNPAPTPKNKSRHPNPAQVGGSIAPTSSPTFSASSLPSSSSSLPDV